MKNLIVYNNNHTVASDTALIALSEGARKLGYKVSVLNPNPFRPGMEEKKADAVIIYGDGKPQKAVKIAYRVLKIPVFDVTNILFSYTTLQHQQGDSVKALLEPEKPAAVKLKVKSKKE
jgi:hypothetical protein